MSPPTSALERLDEALADLDEVPTAAEGAEAVARLGIDVPAWAAEIRALVAAAPAPCDHRLLRARGDAVACQACRAELPATQVRAALDGRDDAARALRERDDARAAAALLLATLAELRAAASAYLAWGRLCDFCEQPATSYHTTEDGVGSLDTCDAHRHATTSDYPCAAATRALVAALAKGAP